MASDITTTDYGCFFYQSYIKEIQILVHICFNTSFRVKYESFSSLVFGWGFPLSDN